MTARFSADLPECVVYFAPYGMRRWTPLLPPPSSLHLLPPSLPTCGSVTTNWPASCLARYTLTAAAFSCDGGSIAAFLKMSCGSLSTACTHVDEQLIHGQMVQQNHIAIT